VHLTRTHVWELIHVALIPCLHQLLYMGGSLVPMGINQVVLPFVYDGTIEEVRVALLEI
jgi:hypothetical protein